LQSSTQRKPPSMDAHLLYTHQNPTRPPPSGTTHTVSSLPRITRQTLSAELLKTPGDPSLAIIDVRDSDYLGGHILGCTNVPSQTLDYRLPELVKTLKDKEVVVFHCALSQQRGPGAALRYLRERERLMAAEGEDGGKKEAEEGKKTEVKEQKVYVLEGGFQEWQEQ
jgi:rhodanese-related sulfurtransferase